MLRIRLWLEYVSEASTIMAVKSNASGASKMDATEAALSAIEEALNLAPSEAKISPDSRQSAQREPLPQAPSEPAAAASAEPIDPLEAAVAAALASVSQPESRGSFDSRLRAPKGSQNAPAQDKSGVDNADIDKAEHDAAANDRAHQEREAMKAVEASLLAPPRAANSRNASAPAGSAKVKPADVAYDQEILQARPARNGETKPVLPSRPPANDDRREIGNLLFSLQDKAPTWPVWIAFLLSALWVAGSGFYVWTRFGASVTAASSLAELPTAELSLSALAVFGPVLFFFGMASIFRRASELRRTSRAMAEIALRLAEPETVAADGVFTLGQAIRREVNSVGDGIERALARAGELEVIVHNEVSAARTFVFGQ